METCMAGEHTAESALPVLDVKNECMGACGPPRALSKTDRWCVAGIRSDRLKEEKAAAGGKKTTKKASSGCLSSFGSPGLHAAGGHLVQFVGGAAVAHAGMPCSCCIRWRVCCWHACPALPACSAVLLPVAGPDPCCHRASRSSAAGLPGACSLARLLPAHTSVLCCAAPCQHTYAASPFLRCRRR